MNTQVLQDPDKFFWLEQGKSIRSLTELFAMMGRLSNEEFSAHVNEEKNDFADWTLNVFYDEPVANLLRSCKTRDECASRISQFLLEEKRNLLEGEPEPAVSEEAVSEEKEKNQETLAPKPEPKRESKIEPESTSESQPETEDKTAPAPEATPLDEEMGDALQKKVERLQHEADEAEEEIIRTASGLPDKIPRLMALEERENELREVLRIHRKLGEDTFMATLILKRVKPRMKLAKMTGEDKEADFIESILEHAEEEMSDLLTTTPLNVKKEVEKIADIQEEHLPRHSPAVASLLKKINGEEEETEASKTQKKDGAET